MPPNPEGGDRFRTNFLADEWLTFCESLEWCTTARWVNKPSKERVAGSKAYQLREAEGVGLRVPRTLITNRPDAVLAFASNEQALIYKRIGVSRNAPPVPTRLFGDDDRARLPTLRDCPAMFQEYIPARIDVRVTFIGGTSFATEIHSGQGRFPTDARLDLAVPTMRHNLDGLVAAQLQDFMANLELDFGAIDLRMTQEGEYVFLEVNPSGQYLFAELLTGEPLTAHLGQFLVGQ
ncbi:hypothetical protein [Pseudonocardia aurantiaca]|uniref:hypothetical protein n=1 Tax=Pseudonocardia aurantiaca TaxID=75290 RepID=UPI0031D31EF7